MLRWNCIKVHLNYPIPSNTDQYQFTRYFIIMLVYFLSPPFYTDNIHLPHDHDPVPPEILGNLKYFPFFKDRLGAIDSTHINCKPSVTNQQVACDCKGAVSQNCLAICNFNMKFLFIFSNWMGQCLTPPCFMMPMSLIFLFCMGSTILPMLGFLYVVHSSFLTGESTITLWNGAMLSFGGCLQFTCIFFG